ncbi:MAG: TetR/AcrR family transcriptional regulator [Flavobacterium sp.]|nr:MAG: TetR/AcrR family transcriptional regulator [Flavobacterium sp.]
MARPKEFDYDEKLQLARDLFWEKGYNNTSLNDLIDNLKINKSSFYNSFSSKHELFLNCLKNYIQEKELEYTNILKSDPDPIIAIENTLRYILNTVTAQARTCLTVNSTFELARTDRQVNELLKDHTLTRVRMFEDLIIKAKDSGRIALDKDPKALAHFLVSGITAIWNIQLTFSDNELTRQTAAVILQSIKS